jgi:uncharacterized protein (DUF433 family)
MLILSVFKNNYVFNASEALYRDISLDPQVRFWMPCIRGMSITVADILDWLASRMSEDSMVTDYPDLTIEDIKPHLLLLVTGSIKSRLPHETLIRSEYFALGCTSAKSKYSRSHAC